MVWIEKFVGWFGGDWQLATLTAVFACFALLSLGVFFKALYTTISFCFVVRKLLRERKKQRATERRRIEFTLPERDNAYLRARLQTALSPDLQDGFEPPDLRLGYAKKLLACVQGAPLSPVERLDVEELAGKLAAFMQKEGWSGGDKKAVNELLARLIKLSAKYDVAV